VRSAGLALPVIKKTAETVFRYAVFAPRLKRASHRRAMNRKHKLDKFFPRNGPCFVHPTRYARHRLIDAIKGRHRAGDSMRSLAADYDLSVAAIRAAVNSSPDDNRMTKKEMKP
jgi:uncharacterized protein (DUF433 family)